MSKYSEMLAPLAQMLGPGNILRIGFKDERRTSFAAQLLGANEVCVMYLHPATGRARIEPWANIDYIEELSSNEDVRSPLHAAAREPLPAASS